MSRRSTAISDLRRAIDRLPVTTREAMLDGVRGSQIIVGAYTDGQGGVCPMLAAHRRGGRHSLLAFAQSWDAFTRAPRKGHRPATRRELQVLERHIVASLRAQEHEPPVTDLSRAIAQHRGLVAERTSRDVERETERLVRERAPEPVVEAPRTRRFLPDWLRPITSIEDYERALAEVEVQQVRLGLVGDTAGPSHPGGRAVEREAEEPVRA